MDMAVEAIGIGSVTAAMPLRKIWIWRLCRWAYGGCAANWVAPSTGPAPLALEMAAEAIDIGSVTAAMPLHMKLQDLDMVAVPMGMRCVVVAMPSHMGCIHPTPSAFSSGYGGCGGWHMACNGSNAVP